MSIYIQEVELEALQGKAGLLSTDKGRSQDIKNTEVVSPFLSTFLS